VLPGPVERSETGGGDPDGSAGGAGGKAPRGIDSPALDRALRSATVIAVLGLGAAGLALPGSLLIGGVAWLVFLWFVLAGWGAIVARIARSAGLDFGLLAALGSAGYVALAGPLIAAGGLTRPVVLALIALGAAGFAWHEATSPVALWHRVRGGLVAARAN